MSRLSDWFTRPWRNLEEARAALEMAEKDQVRVKALANDLRKIQNENHISARVHAAFRGDGP